MTTESFNLIVIGAGPGGYVAAIRAAQLGMKVMCVEKRKTLGGTCLNVGCIPSKVLLHTTDLLSKAQDEFADMGIRAGKVSADLPAMMAHKDKIVSGLTSGIAGLFAKNNVTHLTGSAKLKGSSEIEVNGKTYSAERILLATGSQPMELPFMPFDEENVLSSTGALSLMQVPKQLIVIGAGVIGLELGSVFRRMGSEVTVVEFMDQVLPGMDKSLSTAMQKILQKQGIEFLLGHKLTRGRIGKTRISLRVENQQGEEVKLIADKVLVAIGRRPYTEGLGLEELGIAMDGPRVAVNGLFQTNVPSIYAIGDLIDGPMLAHTAEEEGVACVEMMMGHAAEVRYAEIPGVVYTHPEVASVGFTEEECKKAGIPCRMGQFPFKANSRARCMSEDDGFVKIIAHAHTDRILGVHIIGSSAGELIAEAVTAMSYKASAEDIAAICHAHPTLSEAMKEAALNVQGKAIHI